MAGASREWLDIDSAWLRDYLKRRNLASGYDLEDEFLGAQVSWLLSEDEWTRLRYAWEETRPAKAARAKADETSAAAADAAGADPFAALDDEADQADAGPDEGESPDDWAGLDEAEGFEEADHEGDTEPGMAEAWGELETEAVAPERFPGAAEQRLIDLVDRALTDWNAFKELFRDYPDSEEFDAWEALADSPLAFLRHAERLVRMRAAIEEEKKLEAKRVFEEKVNRAQNVIAGYFLYCRKHRRVPSFEHLVTFIPALKTGHEPEVVKEAWRRESGIKSKVGR